MLRQALLRSSLCYASAEQTAARYGLFNQNMRLMSERSDAAQQPGSTSSSSVPTANSQQQSQTQTQSAASTSGSDPQALDIDSIRKLPGWLKGPMGHTVNKRLGDFEEWVQVTDPKTGENYYKSIVTGECSVPGVPKPDTWTEAVDKKTGLIYYWNKRTGETTAIGEPRPGPYGRKTSGEGMTPPSEDAEAFVVGQPGSSKAGSGNAASSSNPTGGAKGKKEEEASWVVLYNNPLGWLLLGMAILGAINHSMQRGGIAV